MKKFIIFLLVLVAIFAGVWYFWQNFGPKSVKTEYDLTQATDFIASNGGKVEINTVNPTGSVINEEAIPVSTTIDSSLATALINYWSQAWILAPITNSNVKINDDNTVEYSGTFVLNRALGFAKATGIQQEVIDAVTKYIQPFGASFPIYVKGNIEITNNVVNASVSDMNVSVLPVTGVVNDHAGEINSFVTTQLSQDPNYQIKSLKVSDGAFKVDGNVPKNIQYK